MCLEEKFNSDKLPKILSSFKHVKVFAGLQHGKSPQGLHNHTYPLLMNECLFLWHTWALSVVRQCVILGECAKNTHSIANTPPQHTSCWTMTNNFYIASLIHNVSHTAESLVYLKRQGEICRCYRMFYITFNHKEWTYRGKNYSLPFPHWSHFDLTNVGTC